MVEFVTEAKLLAIKEGVYTTYVFKDYINNKYIMCTRLPNWQVQEINIGDEGFLQYQEVNAGDSYYDASIENYKKYNYSNIYFNNFVKKSEKINKEEIIL